MASEQRNCATRAVVVWTLAALATLAGCTTTESNGGGAAVTAAGGACQNAGMQVCGVVGTSAGVLNCSGGTWQPTAVCAAGQVCALTVAGPACGTPTTADAGSGDVLSDAVGDSSGYDVDGSGTDAKPAGCDKPADCDDADPCTTDTCELTSKTCAHAKIAQCGTAAKPCSSTSGCDPGQVCNTASHACVNCVTNTDCGGGKWCKNSQCIASAGCQSDVQCKATAGVCDLVAGVCVPCLKNTDCADTEMCKAQACVPKKVCNSSKDCAGVCDTVAGVCVDCLKNGDCPTGAFCNANKTCQSVICSADVCIAAGLWKCADDGSKFLGIENCTDGNACTTDGCADGKCLYTSIAVGGVCDDGSLCTSNDLCGANGCAGTLVACDDSNPCTKDTCSPTTGKCTSQQLPYKTACSAVAMCDYTGACSLCQNTYMIAPDCTTAKPGTCGGPCASGQQCDAASNQCQTLSCGGSCLSGQKCNAMTNKCYTPCGGACGTSQYCDDATPPGTCKSLTVPDSWGIGGNGEVQKVVKLVISDKAKACDLVNAQGVLGLGDGVGDNALAGASSLIGSNLQDAVKKGTMVILLEPLGYKTDGTKFSFNVLSGAVDPTDAAHDPTTAGGLYTVRPESYDLTKCTPSYCPALTSYANATVKSGQLSASTSMGFATMSLSGIALPIKFNGLSYTGSVTGPNSWINTTGGRLCGYITETDLNAMIDAIPPDVLVQFGGKDAVKKLMPTLIKSDVDSNGDGIKDAKSFALDADTLGGFVTGLTP